jgi:hypothetical protein
MKAITTKYHGATNYKPARMSASDMDGNRITKSYDHDLNIDSNHKDIAQQLCSKMGWTGTLTMGAIKGGYVHVFNSGIPSRDQIIALMTAAAILRVHAEERYPHFEDTRGQEDIARVVAACNACEDALHRVR